MTTRERYRMLRDFHRRVQEAVNDAPTEPSSWHAVLRAKLIMEEALELCSALGVTVEIITMTGASINLHTEATMVFDSAKEWSPGMDAILFRLTGPVNFIAAVDAMRDIEYVVHGTDLVLGTSDAAEETFEEVHLSNMGKVSSDTGGGKAVKPPGWKPPRLGEILRRIFPGQRLLFRD